MTDFAKQARMANAIRFLAADAVEEAKSGHPGLPLGAADIATVLFTRFLKFDPTHPNWPDRDRFVLSAGHGSMLLYAALHLLGYEDFPIDVLKAFRKLGSNAAGHPEFGHGAGIEATTGPLGQGLATAVGMALAERIMNANFGDDIVDHHTYVLASDGDFMEGISQEAISLAGHLRLSRLIVLFDDNQVSIDGPTSLTSSDDIMRRVEASGWTAVSIDGHSAQEIATAIEKARDNSRPTLIACRTTIGYGAPALAGSAAVHGSPLGPKEIGDLRKALDWDAPPFEIPADVRDAWRIAGLRSGHARKEWKKRFEALDNETRGEFERRVRGDLPAGLADATREIKGRFLYEEPSLATRKASEFVLDDITTRIPDMIGGSADLTSSNNTRAKNMTAIEPGKFAGTYIHYGIREHGMAAAMNGMALHGGLIPYGGTFLVFSDYCRGAMRLSALMKQRVIYVLTHDSIGLGEDGPTHQPVEHLASLRAMPGITVFRPADPTETAECWELALEARDRPSVLALTRQAVPAVRSQYDNENRSARGAYEIAASADDAMVSLFASGSEVAIALAAKQLLDEAGIPARVVSVPSFELFEVQSNDYKSELIGSAPIRVAVEAAVRMGWDRFIGENGIFVGMTGFGASAPASDLYQYFGITPQQIVERVRNTLEAAE
ncbi:MAG: transketolase [Hyphomicrobiales bacterium]|nr:MAG: transketolase [Hyphomicrobiales bacterium]